MKLQNHIFTGDDSDIKAGQFLAAGNGAGCKIYQHAETGEIRITNVNAAARDNNWIEIAECELVNHLEERMRDAANESTRK